MLIMAGHKFTEGLLYSNKYFTHTTNDKKVLLDKENPLLPPCPSKVKQEIPTRIITIGSN